MSDRVEPLADHDLASLRCGNEKSDEWPRRRGRTATGKRYPHPLSMMAMRSLGTSLPLRDAEPSRFSTEARLRRASSDPCDPLGQARHPRRSAFHGYESKDPRSRRTCVGGMSRRRRCHRHAALRPTHPILVINLSAKLLDTC